MTDDKPPKSSIWEVFLMKRQFFAKTVMLLGLAAIILLNPTIAMAGTDATSPSVARTKAWDGIEHTLGGVPESVRKIEYQGSVFYLAPSVSDADFLAVLSAGAEALRLKPPQENGKLYNYPVYILWNSDKTALLVHPIIFGYDDILEAVSVPTAPPASLTGAQGTAAAPQRAMNAEEIKAYMLSAEYADAVRNEFYRLLNEYRAANGLRELEINSELETYADIRAEELRTRFSHTRPDRSPAGSGWHNSRNQINSRYAENLIGVGTLSPDPAETANSIFTRWKLSESHNRHMLYRFGDRITMAFGITPKLDDNGLVTSGAVFATGY
jgi:uncharacterized protein YkwD